MMIKQFSVVLGIIFNQKKYENLILPLEFFDEPLLYAIDDHQIVF